VVNNVREKKRKKKTVSVTSVSMQKTSPQTEGHHKPGAQSMEARERRAIKAASNVICRQIVSSIAATE